MESGINFQTVIGVSAGAMSAIGYLSGQIGLEARVNLSYRMDSDYCGRGAMRRDHGITGFSYLFHDILRQDGPYPLDRRRFYDPRRRLVAVATNIETGEPTYFDRDCGKIFRAIRASATVPYISRPVVIDGAAYLDGGCSVHLGYDWALEHGYEKIAVIRTRERTFRAEDAPMRPLGRIEYRRWPRFVETMNHANREYNALLDRIDEDERNGRIFVLAPEESLDLDRFEDDVEKLGDCYWRGYYEMYDHLQELEDYLTGDSLLTHLK